MVVRARPTSRFAHGSLMLNPESSKIDLKLDPGDHGAVNNVNTAFSFKYHQVCFVYSLLRSNLSPAGSLERQPRYGVQLGSAPVRRTGLQGLQFYHHGVRTDWRRQDVHHGEMP